MLLEGSGQLSSEDVQYLASLLCPEAPCSEQPRRSFPRPWYLSSHIRLSETIKAALSAYSAMLSGVGLFRLLFVANIL